MEQLKKKQFRVKFTRTYTTYVTIEAFTKDVAYDIFEELIDEGVVSAMEAEQYNVGDEDVTITEIKF